MLFKYFKIFNLFNILRRKPKDKENEIQKIILGNKTVEFDSNLLRDEEELKK